MERNKTIGNRIGFFRRLAAMAYDGLLLFALLIAANAILIPFLGFKPIQPDNHLYQIYLLYVIYLFFVWFWIHGGQTLGMKAWDIKLVADNGETVGWTQATVRFFGSIISWAILGGGFLWILFDKENRSFHDVISHTHLLRVVRQSPDTSDRKQTKKKKNP